MKLLRKLKTFSCIITGCANWPEVVRVKLGLPGGPVNEIRLRNGLRIELDRGLKADWGEVFEPAVADVYEAAESDADVFIDVGANMGSFSALAGYTHPGARVYAFEPGTDVAAQAARNFQANGIKNVTLINKAVTKDGRIVEFSKPENRGAAGIFENTGDDAIRLESTTLDVVDFAGKKSLFVKLDCEGAEGEIVEWLLANLERLPARIKIACEYHPWCPVPMAETERRLRDGGFRVQERVIFDEAYLFAER